MWSIIRVTSKNIANQAVGLHKVSERETLFDNYSKFWIPSNQYLQTSTTFLFVYIQRISKYLSITTTCSITVKIFLKFIILQNYNSEQKKWSGKQMSNNVSIFVQNNN